MTVERIVDQMEAEEILESDLYDADDHVIARPPWTVARFDRIVPEAIARALRMENGAGLAFTSDSEYRLAGQALRTDRWLSTPSAAMLNGLLTETGHATGVDEDAKSAVGRRRRGGERLTAPERREVEDHAMARAKSWLSDAGWSIEDTSSTRPYDLLATRDGERHYVEVKGTTGDGSEVDVTAGEVGHARAHPDESVLAVISGIELEHSAKGEPQATGGRLRVSWPWRPRSEDLRPTAFRHTTRGLTDPPSAATPRAPADDWDAFVADVVTERRRAITSGDRRWAAVSESLLRRGWALEPYQTGRASGAVLRRAIDDGLARGLAPDDGSLVSRHRRP